MHRCCKVFQQKETDKTIAGRQTQPSSTKRRHTHQNTAREKRKREISNASTVTHFPTRRKEGVIRYYLWREGESVKEGPSEKEKEGEGGEFFAWCPQDKTNKNNQNNKQKKEKCGWSVWDTRERPKRREREKRVYGLRVFSPERRKWAKESEDKKEKEEKLCLCFWALVVTALFFISCPLPSTAFCSLFVSVREKKGKGVLTMRNERAKENKTPRSPNPHTTASHPARFASS